MITKLYYFLKIGQDRETDDENPGGKGLTNPNKVEPFYLEAMKGCNDKNLAQVTNVIVYLKQIPFSPCTIIICFITEIKISL